MHVNPFWQALANDAGWDHLYGSLPTEIQSDTIIWQILQDAIMEETILFEDMTYWTRFMVGFFHQWAEADWIPTFEMLLIHDEHTMTMRKFKATLTVLN